MPHRVTVDSVAIALLDIVEQAIEVIHVETINPVNMRMSGYSFSDMGFDRQDSARAYVPRCVG